MEPITNEEVYLAALVGDSVVLPDPITRKEIFLAAAAGMAVSVPDPITREEMYLSQIKPGDGSGVVIRNQNKTITENGTYKADSGYTGLGTVTVAVPIPETKDPVLTEITITENGEYTPEEGVDGFSKVTVEVENPLDYAVSLQSMFGQGKFPTGYEADITFCKYGTPSASMLFATFNRSSVTSIKLTCGQTVTTAFSMEDFCRSATRLEKVDLSGIQPLKPSSIATAFYSCYELQEIIGAFDLSECSNTKTPFQSCISLETVQFVPGKINASLSLGQSPLLSDESIQSIIDGLADLIDGTAKTLTLHADVGAKLTDEQKAAAAAKNWTLAY